MNRLPDEIWFKICQSLDHPSATIISEYPIVNNILSRRAYWRNKPIKITDRKELNQILRNPVTKKATFIEISNTDLDDLDLEFIARHFFSIHQLVLNNNANITDEGIFHITSRHGKSLRILKLGRMFGLTNVSATEYISQCNQLKILHLESCMFSTTGIKEILSNMRRLADLSLSRCHLVTLDLLPSLLEVPENLKYLNLSHLDGLQPFQVEMVLELCKRLKKIEIVGCPEFTLKNVKQLQNKNPPITIVHDARLEDHSFDAVKRYLLGMIAR